MSDVSHLLWLIPALPLAAAALIAFLGPKVLRGQSHWPCVLAAAGACALSLWVFGTVFSSGAEQPPLFVHCYTVFHVAGAVLDFNLRADALTALMLVMITFIGTLIAIYSVGYMHGELGGGHGDHGHNAPTTPSYAYPRFFAEVALFIASMTLLVLADNLWVLFAGWEGVGLCSYLLVGFWFAKPAAANAANKAFLVTRIGDMGMFLGIMLLWIGSGYHVDFESVFANFPQNAGGYKEFYLTTACLLLLCGAAGKSAQFPLQVWLPDAMEGPTPVSALIHAATMVTAGVYLIARCTPLFVQAPIAQLVVACIGAFTALFAALIALTRNDLKRVLAYSTLSQLGYMFLGLGCAVGFGGFSPDGKPQAGAEATAAVSASMFHLFTHAFFKALLFLAAGSVMHAMGNVIDMRRFSGLRKVMPTTHWTFLIGALALSGLPPFSGFWSKDEIVGAAFDASHSSAYGGVYFILFIAAMLTAFLTAFYTFRAYFLTFWGEVRVPEEAGGHAHESPAVMTAPLIILAVFAAGVGAALALPPFSLFGNFLLRTPGLVKVPEAAPAYLLMGVSAIVAAAGIGLAWWMYVRQPGAAAEVAQAIRPAYVLSSNKFFVDELYGYFLVKPVQGFARFLRIMDLQVLDGIVDVIGNVPRLIGVLFWPIQNGLVQYYALLMLLGLTVFLLALVRYL
ncbi:MAG TPA: NADH-quinone oxidoreductase subunit L [Planctomycetales bacterium]|jgi:NADH-quinone oxidoreductase subunit L|nr:NADH-quinone oxidoreductase subunit L [Planctomycetales bacterium]